MKRYDKTPYGTKYLVPINFTYDPYEVDSAKVVNHVLNKFYCRNYHAHVAKYEHVVTDSKRQQTVYMAAFMSLRTNKYFLG